MKRKKLKNFKIKSSILVFAMVIACMSAIPGSQAKAATTKQIIYSINNWEYDGVTTSNALKVYNSGLTDVTEEDFENKKDKVVTNSYSYNVLMNNSKYLSSTSRAGYANATVVDGVKGALYDYSNDYATCSRKIASFDFTDSSTGNYFYIDSNGDMKSINEYARNSQKMSTKIGVPAEYVYSAFTVPGYYSAKYGEVASVSGYNYNGYEIDFKIYTQFDSNYHATQSVNYRVIYDLSVSLPDNYDAETFTIPSELTIDSLQISSKIGDTAVTTIKNETFPIVGFSGFTAGYKNIKNLIIPEGIKFINDNACSKCSNLENVKFEKPEDIAYIGYRAFSGTALTSIDLTGLLRDEDNFSVLQPDVFAECKSLAEVNYTNSENEISDYVYIPRRLFYNCSNLSNVNFMTDTEELYIGDYAFYACSFKELKFEKDTYVGENAFEKNSKLESVEFKGNAEIEESAFLNSFATTNNGVVKSVIFNKSAILGFDAFKSCGGISVVRFNGEKKSDYTHIPTVTPTVAINGAESTTEPTLTPDSENQKDAEYETTLYKGCFSGTKVTNIKIDTDEIDLHNECFEGISTLKNLELGGTKLNTFGGLFDNSDKLSEGEIGGIEISSTSVRFCSDCNDYCKYKASDCDETYNPKKSIYTGAFTRSSAKNLVFTKDVELVSGSYRYTENSDSCGHASGTPDQLLNIYLYNPTIKFAVSEKSDITTDEYLGFYSLWHFVPQSSKKLNIYGYQYGDDSEYIKLNYKTETFAISYINDYGEVVAETNISLNNSNLSGYYDNINEGKIALSEHYGVDAFEDYCRGCDNFNKMSFTTIQDSLCAEYTSGDVVVGTKFDESKLLVTQSYFNPNNQMRYDRDEAEPIECQGVRTSVDDVSSNGFVYTVSGLDSDGCFTSKKCTVNVSHGSESVKLEIYPEERNSESFDVEVPNLVEGMTLSKSDFVIKNLVYNYSDEMIADAGTAASLNAKIIVYDEKGEQLTDFVWEDDAAENGTEATKLKKGTYSFYVKILEHGEYAKVNDEKDIVVSGKKLSKLEVSRIDANAVVYENDAINNNNFEVKAFYNNGNTNDYITLAASDFVIDKEKYSSGNNVLKFTYKGDSSITGEIKVENVVAEKIVSMSSNIDVAYSTMPEGSDIPWEHLGLIVTYNSKRTHTLTAEEIKEHCTTASDSTIVAGKACDFDIFYDGVESGIKATVKIVGTEKKLNALFVTFRSDADEISESVPEKVFYIGDTVNADDLFVIAYYNNGKDKITDYKDYVISNAKLAGKDNTVTIALKEDTNVSTELKVSAKEPVLTDAGITVTYSGPTTIEEGHQIDLSDLVVVAHYENGNVVLKEGEYTIEQYTIQNQVETEIKIWYKGYVSSIKVIGSPSTTTLVPTMTIEPIATPVPTMTTEPTATPVPTTTTELKATPIATMTTEPTATPVPTKVVSTNTTVTKATATPVPTKKQTFTWKSSNKSIKLQKTSAKTTYKIYTNKTIKLTPSVTDGDVYYQIVKSGKKVGKSWKKVNKQITIKSTTRACVYIKYTLNGKTVTKKTKGFVLDKNKPKISVANSGKLKVTDKDSGIKSIKDGKKKIKNGTVLKKGVHKIVAVDKAGNKKTMKVTIK
jgi:hypothetical protein